MRVILLCQFIANRLNWVRPYYANFGNSVLQGHRPAISDSSVAVIWPDRWIRALGSHFSHPKRRRKIFHNNAIFKK